jgi:hypothetical protein
MSGDDTRVSSLEQQAASARLLRCGRAAKFRLRHLDMWATRAGRRSRARLRDLHNRHAGETCAVVGNGPSMRDFDVGRLRGIPTFCLNRGYLLWERAGSMPSYYVAVNDLVLAQFRHEIAELRCPLFLPWIHRESYAALGQTVFFELRPFATFLPDARRGVAPGATVTLAALQLAFHMGYSEVILLGIDHRFATTGRPHSEVVQIGADRNHFAPDYFSEGTRWNLPDLAASERGYHVARARFEAVGRRIVNATPDSALDVFERHPLDALLEH